MKIWCLIHVILIALLAGGCHKGTTKLGGIEFEDGTKLEHYTAEDLNPLAQNLKIIFTHISNKPDGSPAETLAHDVKGEGVGIVYGRSAIDGAAIVLAASALDPAQTNVEAQGGDGGRGGQGGNADADAKAASDARATLNAWHRARVKKAPPPTVLPPPGTPPPTPGTGPGSK